MRTAHIRALAKSDVNAAKAELAALLVAKFDIEARHIAINEDQYSLNSLNGFFDTDNGAFFFKFHQEEGEDQMRGEYYRADLLVRENLPVDMPVLAANEPGEQILVYRRRQDRRFSDVLFDLDAEPENTRNQALHQQAVAAERDLNAQIFAVAKRTLHPVSAAQVGREAIHRLFYERMIDLPSGNYPGGRYSTFYVGKTFDLPGARLHWDALAQAKLVLNGQEMAHTFGDIFNTAHQVLNPDALAGSGGVVAHGDAHNANVWFEETGGQPKLCYFDPAFAGEYVPSLLAEVKATFHNVFAHPLWLYNPAFAQARYTAHANFENGVLAIDTNWQPSQLRYDLLEAKIEAYWRPFMRLLGERNLLPNNWRQTIQSALAMCPALVTNLRAHGGGRDPTSSAIGLYVTALMGSTPRDGQTMVTHFLDAIDPAG